MTSAASTAELALLERLAVTVNAFACPLPIAPTNAALSPTDAVEPSLVHHAALERLAITPTNASARQFPRLPLADPRNAEPPRTHAVEPSTAVIALKARSAMPSVNANAKRIAHATPTSALKVLSNADHTDRKSVV